MHNHLDEVPIRKGGYASIEKLRVLKDIGWTESHGSKLLPLNSSIGSYLVMPNNSVLSERQFKVCMV